MLLEQQMGAPELFGRYAFHSLKEFAEAGLVGEMQAFRDGGQTKVGGLQQP